MEQSNPVERVDWVSAAAMFGAAIVGAFSVLMLFSFGGQLIVAPALLPVQWLIARNTAGWVSTAFAVLGALLMLEAVWLAVMAVSGGGALAVGAGICLGLVGGIAFITTSREGK